MPNWTKEQQEAISKEGCNIIVSAGAGSGKTAVLTERVIRKLKSGVNIRNLLVLTFTNAAAFEMKERIREAIQQVEELKEQLDYIDGSYITTFDSYSLSLVKKYHYLLNISKNVTIIDNSVIYTEKKRYLDAIFASFYEKEDEDFLQLIDTFCTKDDEEIKKYILTISNKLDLKYYKKEYLETYIEKMFSLEKVHKDISLFENMLLEKIKQLSSLLSDLSLYVPGDYYGKILDVLNPLLEAENYDTIVSSLDVSLPNLPRGSEAEVKKLKTAVTEIIDLLKEICIYDSKEEIVTSIMSTKVYVRAIIKIIQELDAVVNQFKHKNHLYEFIDISKMAIQILKENPLVCEELKNYFNEIMVDEYQDTSDLQEEFIQMIENDNVYMVGDIKQSIYRFRNANPYIFKTKYDNYAIGNDGYKIDLNKNFRSREETLVDINIMFNVIMDDLIGGANYSDSHQMVFGNMAYETEGKTSQNNHLEIYSYTPDETKTYSKEEIEIFMIGNDIKNKINSGYLVYDRKKGLRKATYNDFVILMDRSTKFDLYKKIFEYLQIPLTKYTDTTITDKEDILLIKNILNLIICTKKKDFGVDFRYSFMSVGRSNLFAYSDEELFDYLNEETYFNSTLMGIVGDILSSYDVLTIYDLLSMIIDKFSFYDKLITVGDIKASSVRVEYLLKISKNMMEYGYTIEEFYQYLVSIIENEYDIKVSISEAIKDSVKIMTIHKSKGLEYYVCYYSGLYASFNISDLKDKFLFGNSYGMISPFFKEGIAPTIYKFLYKEEYIKEEISEKIRLWYVALTRCKEKMIVVAPIQEEEDGASELVDYHDRLKYRSFLDILNSIHPLLMPYIKEIDLKEVPVTKDYNYIKMYNYEEMIDSTEENLVFEDVLPLSSGILEESSYSKKTNELVSKELKEKLEFGNYIHSLLESVDLKHPDFSFVPSRYRPMIEKLLDCGLDFANANIYKEYEFIYEEDGQIHHGVIDLVLEFSDHIDIVDYKLKNVEDDMYAQQLNGYRRYIEKKCKKNTNLYLYSLLDSILKKI